MRLSWSYRSSKYSTMVSDCGHGFFGQRAGVSANLEIVPIEYFPKDDGRFNTSRSNSPQQARFPYFHLRSRATSRWD